MFRRLRAPSRSMALAALAATAFIALSAIPASAANFPARDSLYHSYTEMVADIHAVETAHPDIVHVFSIGKSYQGRDIWAAKISDNVGDRRDRARDPVRRAPPCPRAPDRRAGPLPVPPARERLRHRRPDQEHRRHPRGLDHLRRQPRRLRVRPDLHERQPRPVLRVAEEPPAERRFARRSGPTSTGTTTTTGGAAAARPARSRRSPYRGPKAFSAPETQAVADFVLSRGRRRDPADQGPHHVPHERQADPLAVRSHEDRHPARHVRRRPPRLRRDRQGDGRAERLQGRAVERPLHHRRRPDRLDVRPAADLLVHDRALSARDVDGLGRPLPARREDRAGDRAQPERADLLPEHGGCPYVRDRQTIQNCGPFFDDTEISRGWVVNPDGNDTARSTSRFVREQPVADERLRPPDAAGRHPVGPLRVRAPGRAARLEREHATTSTARRRSGASRSPSRRRRARCRSRTSSAHGPSSAADFFRVYVEDEGGTKHLVWQVVGTASTVGGVVASRPGSASPTTAGQKIRLMFRANDGGHDSLVEALVDDIRVERPS